MKAALDPTHQLLQLCQMDRTWVRGAGVWLFDESGRGLLDGYAQYGALGLGHNAPATRAAARAALDEGEPAIVQLVPRAARVGPSRETIARRAGDGSLRVHHLWRGGGRGGNQAERDGRV